MCRRVAANCSSEALTCASRALNPTWAAKAVALATCRRPSASSRCSAAGTSSFGSAPFVPSWKIDRIALALLISAMLSINSGDVTSLMVTTELLMRDTTNRPVRPDAAAARTRTANGSASFSRNFIDATRSFHAAR